MNAPKLSIKDYVTITVFVISAVGLYYRMNTDTQLLKDKVERMEQKLEKVNPEAIEVELDYLSKDIEQVNQKLDIILDKMD